MRIMFYQRGLLKILAYLSACPPGEIPRGDRVGMPNETAADAVKRFPSPVRFVAVLARWAGHARPCRPLLINESPNFLTDLEAPSSKMLPGPAADTAARFKVADGFTGFDDQDFPSPSRQRDGFSSFPIQHLLDRCSIRFLPMFLALPLRFPRPCLIHHRPETFTLIPIRPGYADIHANITSQDIGRKDWLYIGELDKDAGDQSAVLALSDFAHRSEGSAAPQRILERSVSLRWNPSARRRFNPVGIARALRFLDLRVTEQRKISRAVKCFARSFLGSEARIDNAARPLLGLVRNPPKPLGTLRQPLLFHSLGKVFRAVVKRILSVPPAGIASLFSFARVRFDLQRIGTNDTSGLHFLGTSHLADLHLGQIRTSTCRGLQVYPHRQQVNGLGK